MTQVGGGGGYVNLAQLVVCFCFLWVVFFLNVNSLGQFFLHDCTQIKRSHTHTIKLPRVTIETNDLNTEIEITQEFNSTLTHYTRSRYDLTLIITSGLQSLVAASFSIFLLDASMPSSADSFSQCHPHQTHTITPQPVTCTYFSKHNENTDFELSVHSRSSFNENTKITNFD